jgi:hypothetical protein
MRPIIEVKSLEVSAFITQMTFAKSVQPIYVDETEGRKEAGEGIKKAPIITLQLTDLGSDMSVESINMMLRSFFVDGNLKLRVRIEVEDANEGAK